MHSEQKKNTDDGVKFSLKDNFDVEFDRVINFDKYYNNNVFVIGNMPSLYGQFGIDTSLDLTITPKHLRSAVKPKDTARHFHGLSKEIIKSAVLKLDNPAVVSFNENGVIYVTVSETDSENVPITFVIKPNGTVYIGDSEVRSNHSLSIYGRDNTLNFINKALNDGRILMANKNEATIIEQILHQQFQDNLFNSDFANSIRRYKEIVNPLDEDSSKESTSEHKSKGKYSTRYSYDDLVLKPDMKIITLTEQILTNRKDIINITKANAAKIGTIHIKL